MDREVTIAGGGVAGLNLGRELERRGYETEVFERLPSDGHIEKSIFTLNELVEEEGLEETIVNVMDTYRIVTTFDKDLEYSVDDLSHGGCLIDYPSLLDELEERYTAEGGTISYSEGVESVESLDGSVEIETEKGRLESKHFVDATGPESNVLRNSGFLDDDPFVIGMYGSEIIGEFNPDVHYNVFGEEVGKCSWVTPKDEDRADLIAGSYYRMEDEDMFEELENRFGFLYENLDELGIGRTEGLGEEMFMGFIRTSPVRDIPQDNIHCLGEAAGHTSPYTGDALRPCFYYSNDLAESIDNDKDFDPSLFDNDTAVAMRNLRIKSYDNIARLIDLENDMIEGLEEEDMYGLLKGQDLSNSVKLHLASNLISNPSNLGIVSKFGLERAKLTAKGII
ncbi:MAG: NAD(P)/FAD-dependent oxidoreductase [Candidatus Aenigmatarchaeota archaeon]